MKYIKLYEEFLNESIEMRTSIVNGKKLESNWAGAADNLKDFIKLIEGLPETIKSVKVQTGTSNFNPEQEEIKGPIKSSDIKKIIKLVKDADKAFNKKGETIHTFELNSFFGVSSNAEKHATDPAYIQYRTKSGDQFAKDMSSGKHGPLD